jgi:N-carbamoyl-L-amino-acid hydrolase
MEGFTTVQSLGSPADIPLRDAIMKGMLPGPRILDALIHACEKHALRFERMISRAYHDSLFMSRIAPTAMLFIPCRGGVSHRPDEYASPEAITHGALVLAEALAQLAG